MPDLPRELLAIFLAVALFPVLAMVHLILFRLKRKDSSELPPLLLAFASYCCVWGILWLLLMGRSENVLTELIAGVSMVGFLCLGYMEAFSMICRGFSLTMMSDVERNGSLSFKEIIEQYGGGHGIDWLFEKRLNTLESLQMIRRESSQIEIGGIAGVMAGRLGRIVKSILRMGEGG